jgi:tetratricopeptide (TPR) repeat protein
VRGYLREGEAWLEKLLALAAAANLASWRNDYPLARQRAETALATFRQMSDLPGQAIGLQESSQRREFDLAQRHLHESAGRYLSRNDDVGLAEALGWQGMLLGIGEKLMQESIALCRKTGHALGLALRASDLASLYLCHGQLATAQSLLEESLAIQRRLGCSATICLVSLLGNVALNQRRAAQARQHLEEAAALANEFDLTQLGLWDTCHLGYACLQLGDLATAEGHFAESLRRFAESDQKSGVIYAVEGFASLSVCRGEWARVVQLYAWADVTRTQIGIPRPPVEQADVAQNLALAQECLEMGAFHLAAQTGKQMTMAESIQSLLGQGM